MKHKVYLKLFKSYFYQSCENTGNFGKVLDLTIRTI